MQNKPKHSGGMGTRKLALDQAQAREGGSRFKHPAALACVLLFSVVLWTFFPAINNDFVGYDDPDYVTDNRHVRGGLTWSGIEWAFRSVEASNWHPLTWC